jgi:cell division protein FtsW (lipid II flippase)
MNLLPEKHTDFIFTVIAEDGGFLLATLALLLLLFIALSGFGIALKTREPAGRLIAVGVSVLLLSQGLLNAGVAVGLFPTTGITFPLISYGGSSLISSIICVGLMINVGSRREPLWSKDPFE